MMDDKVIEKIYVGCMEGLPGVSSKIVRIFTSSTFTDTQMERNALMAEVYPKIKEYCREKHGLEFQVVDMRWGIRDEATDDHMTTELCMKEIINCQRLSLGPNFVVFMGQKFGYRPIPTYVLSSELATLRETLVEIGEDTRLMDLWYKKDTNAVPPVHILQPISSILTNFLNKNEPKLQSQDQAIWWDTLTQMQKLLRKAAHKCHVDGKFSAEEKHNYFMSVTEREIINGILNVEDPKSTVIGYVRILNNINLQNVKKACNYIDFINRSLDHEAIRLLSDLRDERVHKKLTENGAIYKRYPLEWMGREGLTAMTHGEYLSDFLAHFYLSIIKLVDRAMRKVDASEEGRFVTEILQHLNTCSAATDVFYGREEGLERAKAYILNDNDLPLILYGAGGSGKTSLLSKIASDASGWLRQDRGDDAAPFLLVRYCGTTPDSSAVAQLLISLCKQISIVHNLAQEDIPADLIPLTAHFKNLLTLGSHQRPLLLFLDSVESLAGVAGGKLTFLPLTKLPPHCKIILSCVAEPSEPTISQDYHTLRKILDGDKCFLEISSLGEPLAKHVIQQWLARAGRAVNNYQWRVVCNVLEKCSLPIFVKLVFGEIVRWKSYSKAGDTQLATRVMDSIFKLFDRVEFQHGPLLVSHALAYITASKNGLSESELEDLISMDDIVLDDVYQYHMPPVRRIPPLLWTRIRNDLPNYFSEREADGVSVLNWYHRQFVDAARERYFSKEEQIIYYHSSIADYFLGIWGGGKPKPFRFTEMQKYRFNLKSRDGESDRKLPLQPLAYYNRDGKISRYNLRKLGELPFHLVRSKRFNDLYDHVLFNYQWLCAKIAACPLQAVLFDFEDACTFIEDEGTCREIMLVADALRLSGAILLNHPKMLGPHLVARLLPEINSNPNIKKLLKQCDTEGIKDNALIPAFHAMHTPGGPLKYSLEGHPFAVFGFCVTADFRYIVSVSNKFLTWDLATSDLTREILVNLEGILHGLVISPDNRYGSAYSSRNQIVLLNMLTNEFQILENPLDEHEVISGLCLLNTHLIVYGAGSWAIFDVKGVMEELVISDYPYKPILSMSFVNLKEYFIVHWSGDMECRDMILRSTLNGQLQEKLHFHSVLEFHSGMRTIYCCMKEYGNTVVEMKFDGHWTFLREFPNNSEQLFKVQLSPQETHLFGTFLNGYKVWSLEDAEFSKTFLLPESIKNVSAKMLESNTLVVSRDDKYALAGVRKNIYVWDMESEELLKELDAHFGRINKIQSLVVSEWNCLITASLDRTIKIWNIDNILKKVHVIDRHELPIDAISISPERNIAVTCTRNCMGLWDLSCGKLIARLADAPLGAIVSHACISRDGKYIISSESGNVLIWDVGDQRVLFREEQSNIRQMFFISEDALFLTASRATPNENKCKVSCRRIPQGQLVYEVKFPYRNLRDVVVSEDQSFLVGPGYLDKKDTLYVYDLANGKLLSKILPVYPGFKDYSHLTQVPSKGSMIALIDSEQANLFDVKQKKFVRSIPKWGGLGTRDGKYGLFCPPRGGLDLIELKRGKTIQTFIPKVAEGVYRIITMFTESDEYVVYYHAGRKTIRFFRSSDAKMIASYFLSSEITTIASTVDGFSLIIGTDDGCLIPLVIADPEKEGVQEYLENLPSRKCQDLKPRKFHGVVKTTTILLKAISKDIKD